MFSFIPSPTRQQRFAQRCRRESTAKSRPGEEIMGARSKFDQTKWRLERERFHLPDPAPPHPEPDLSLRSAITQLFTKLDSQTGSSIHKIQTKWKIIAGENVAGHSCPGRLAGNVLYVYVDSSVWLDEISRFHSENILRKIQSEIGAGTVKSMRFQVNPKECRMAFT